MARRPMPRWGYFLIGGFCVAMAGQGILEIKDSQTWPSTSGVITSSDVSKKRVRRDGPDRSEYVAQVTYEYQVDDMLYSAGRTGWEKNAFNSRFAAEQFLSDYPVGRQVEVFYNPDNPKAAILNRGDGSIGYLGLILVMGAVFFLIGLFK